MTTKKTKKKKILALSDPPMPGTLEPWMGEEDLKRIRRFEIIVQRKRSQRAKDAVKKRKIILKAFMETTLYQETFMNFDHWKGFFHLCRSCDGVEPYAHTMKRSYFTGRLEDNVDDEEDAA